RRTAGATALQAPVEPATKPAVRCRLHRSAVRARRAADSGRACDGADRQEKRASHFQSDAQALGRGTQLCLAGQEQEAVEELRAMAQHQPAVRPLGILGALAQKTLNTL